MLRLAVLAEGLRLIGSFLATAGTPLATRIQRLPLQYFHGLLELLDLSLHLHLTIGKLLRLVMRAPVG